MSLLSTISLLLVMFATVPACKRSGLGADLTTNSIRFIQVGDKVALTFNSRAPAKCSAVVNSQTIQCAKIPQDNNTYYADLGALDKNKTHTVELDISADSFIKHTLTYRYRAPTSNDAHYLRLDIQNKAGEIHRGKVANLPEKGCRILNSTKPSKLTSMPLYLQRFITAGFASASASPHIRNKNVARIFYSRLDFSSDWDFYLMERQVGTRFILPSPAKLESFDIAKTALGSDLGKNQPTIPIPRGETPKLNWTIKNPSSSIFLTLKIYRDDRSVVGECWIDPGQGMAKIETSFWQRLAAGRYSIDALLISQQRLVIQGSGAVTAWQINAYDWRYGYFTKT